jgi:hypothetical protein
MNKEYKALEITIYQFDNEDIVTLSTSGEIDGDETKYPIPDGWAE